MEKLFFNKGSISGLVLLGQGEKQFVAEKNVPFFLRAPAKGSS